MERQASWHGMILSSYERNSWIILPCVHPLGAFFSMLFLTLRREQPDCPSLRASNAHRVTVRVLRARRAPGHSLPFLDIKKKRGL